MNDDYLNWTGLEFHCSSTESEINLLTCYISPLNAMTTLRALYSSGIPYLSSVTVHSVVIVSHDKTLVTLLFYVKLVLLSPCSAN